MKQLSKIFLLPSLIALSLGVFFYFHNRGLTVHDEGYILDAAWRFAQGEVIYRDFFIQYTPGIVFTLGTIFKFTGPSIIAGRLLMVLVGGLISLLLYITTRSLLPSLLFVAWGIPQLNFPWPTWFALLFMLLSLITSKKPFLSGAFASLTFLFKQNFGLATILAHLLTQPSLLGLMLPLLPVGLYFFNHQALNPALDTIFTFNFRYIGQGIMSTPLPSINLTSVLGLAKAFFYYFPFTLLAFYAIKILRRQLNHSQTITAVYLGLFFLSGFRPTTDILHISLIYPALFPLIAMLKPKWALLLFMPIFILGLYKLYFKPYAGFEAPYPQQSQPVNFFGQTLLVDDRAAILPQLVDAINRSTRPQDPIFIYPYAPMVYFLSGHPNASRYPLTVSNYLPPSAESEIISQLNRVNLIVIQSALAPQTSQILYHELTNQFPQITAQIGDYQVRRRL